MHITGYSCEGVDIDCVDYIIEINKIASTKELYNLMMEIFDNSEFMDFECPIEVGYKRGRRYFKVINGWTFKYGESIYKKEIPEFAFIRC